MRRPVIFAACACSVAALAAGCGSSSNSSTSASANATPATAAFPRDGVSFDPPAGWSLGDGKGTLVATVQAGQATVAVWRYPRSEALPRTASLKVSQLAVRELFATGARQPA